MPTGSLRTFHFVFIFIVIVAADMFGAWAVWRYSETKEGLTLAIGVLSFLFSFAVVGYLIWLIRKLERQHIE